MWRIWVLAALIGAGLGLCARISGTRPTDEQVDESISLLFRFTAGTFFLVSMVLFWVYWGVKDHPGVGSSTKDLAFVLSLAFLALGVASVFWSVQGFPT